MPPEPGIKLGQTVAEYRQLQLQTLTGPAGSEHAPKLQGLHRSLPPPRLRCSRQELVCSSTCDCQGVTELPPGCEPCLGSKGQKQAASWVFDCRPVTIDHSFCENHHRQSESTFCAARLAMPCHVACRNDSCRRLWPPQAHLLLLPRHPLQKDGCQHASEAWHHYCVLLLLLLAGAQPPHQKVGCVTREHTMPQARDHLQLSQNMRG